MSYGIEYDEDEQAEQQRLRRQCLAEIDELAANWSCLGAVERGEHVVDILGYGISNRKLAKVLRCSEGLIRHYEIIGFLTDPWKQALREGRYSARQVVDQVRRLQKQEARSMTTRE